MDFPRLRCVECGKEDLVRSAAQLRCDNCGTEYPLHSYRSLPVIVSRRSPLNAAEILAHEVVETKLELDAAERHWSTGALAKLIASCPRGNLLSYGGGDGGDRKWLEDMGYHVTAFDVYPGPFTDLVCDGHELPLASGQFDVVTSVAVFEHLYNPFQAAAEKYRVLKPGGVLVGSVAFLEPFHAHSYFHMSHLGLTEVLQRAGFREIEITPGWSWVESLNGNFWLWNQVPAIRAITKPFNRLRYGIGLGLWKLAYAAKRKPIPSRLRLMYCGSLQFKATK